MKEMWGKFRLEYQGDIESAEKKAEDTEEKPAKKPAAKKTTKKAAEDKE